MTFLSDEAWRGRAYSGGWVTPAGGDAAVTEPATGAELGRTGIAAPADMTRAAQQAAAAQPAWAALPHTQRSAILRRAADIWLANAAEIEQWSIREGGKVAPAAQFETHVATGEIYEAATLPSRPYGELIPSEQPRLSFAERVPAGVVGVIAPFNFPQILAIRSVAPALALGNAVILKPDPRTAVCGGVVLARVFEEAGLPEGLLHVLPGGPEAGEALITDPLVRIISFTGSTAAGRHVGELAARHLKRAHLELGGNSALVILDDADLEGAASAGAWGSFLHQGLFYQPTVLAGVTPEMPAYASEVFGPVAPVVKFGTLEEAAALAARSEYGLSLGILTRDVMRGLDLARRIPTGIVHINEQTVDDEPNVPFGGILDSGTGARFGGTANLEAFTETRWVTMRGDIAPYPF
jgi:acyl-CoA reductase-like NAD-dependent aldehyde dehydrogenase